MDALVNQEVNPSKQQMTAKQHLLNKNSWFEIV